MGGERTPWRGQSTLLAGGGLPPFLREFAKAAVNERKRGQHNEEPAHTPLSSGLQLDLLQKASKRIIQLAFGGTV